MKMIFGAVVEDADRNDDFLLGPDRLRLIDACEEGSVR